MTDRPDVPAREGDEPAPPVLVAFVPDLMDRSKVSAAAVGPVTFVARASDVAGTADSVGATIVVVDLARPGALEAIAAVVASGSTPRIVGFGSHVDRDVLAAAREAGADQVLARSAFFGDLAGHLG